jgi:hypothetical protein
MFAFLSGKVKKKVLPLPTSLLSKPIRPWCISINERQIERPRPVPPVFRVGESSTCEKGWNSFDYLPSAIPGPVSETVTMTSDCPDGLVVTPAPMTIEPSSVNFAAFDKKLSNT